ncbi:MAG: hypothetical protein VKJ87_01225 [Synechococcus sp.]|nr:hypothetical protein [Synechococcus sp.]
MTVESGEEMLIQSLVLGAGLLMLAAPVQAASIQACAEQLRSKGYVITDMDVESHAVFEFEAIRNQAQWDITTDANCKILLEKRDD